MLPSMFSLRSLALAKVAVVICNDPEIRVSHYVSRHLSDECIAKQMKRILLIQKKISNLNLPLVLEKDMNILMGPISDEIAGWKMDHSTILGDTVMGDDMEYIWKDKGTIDRLKTAKHYTECESKDISLRFQMACVYWLEDAAKRLWDEMPETTRRDLSAVRSQDQEWETAVEDWITMLKSGASDWRQHSFSHPLPWYCQDSLVIQGNLLQQLPLGDQMHVLRDVMKKDVPIRTRSFCLSRLDAKQFAEVFEKEPLNGFLGLLHWPFYLQYHEVADRIFANLTEDEFCEGLTRLVFEKMRWKLSRGAYLRLLNDVWFTSPERFKEHIEHTEFFGSLEFILNCNFKSVFDVWPM
ncbi:uncharacterized protein NPIL_189341 [Nephila pilipes]|uniref:Uncharacterized protein n=1 Tax=Nephila pilipes TaxID=299642 RepID=A0A8X6MWW4_NEPPI|nr:uncharacterized protein NPIL_189341 [Nephila pilipes]